MVTCSPSQVTSLSFSLIMHEHFEHIEEKDQICSRETKKLQSNDIHSKSLRIGAY